MNNKDILKKIPRIDWVWEWKRKCTPYSNYCIIRAWTGEEKAIKWKAPYMLMFDDGECSISFLEKKGLIETGEEIYTVVMKDDFIQQWEKKRDESCERLVKLSRYDPKKEVMKQYHEWTAAYITAISFVTPIRAFSRHGERTLKQFIASKTDDVKEQAEMFSVLTGTTRGDVFADFHDALGEAYELKKKGKKYKNLMKKIVQDFIWFPVSYGDEAPLSEEDVERQIESFEHTSHSESDKKTLIKMLSPPKDILRLIEIFDLFSYSRDYVKRRTNYAHYYSLPLFEAVGEKYGMTLAEVKSLTPDEIGKRGPRKSHMLFGDGKKIHIFDFHKELLDRLFGSEKEIKGYVASVGKAKGKVVIMNSSEDMKKAFKGCVIVSHMTTPGMTPAMHLASAIVTDEGGIACHAAVVARELKIPCVIGTKNATTVLKDGDLVEVDAEKGMVRKLS